MKVFVKYAFQKATLKRSVKVASVVGTALAAINHYDMFLSGVYSTRRCIQIMATYVVPFSVSTVSAALQGREMELRRAEEPMAVPDPYRSARRP